MSHVPIWVYVLFILLLYIGIKRCYTRVISVNRLAIIPIVFICFGLHSILQIFGMSILVITWLLLGAIGGFLVSHFWIKKSRIVADKKNRLIQVPGDVSLLIMLIMIFCIEFFIHYAIDAHWPIAAASWLRKEGIATANHINIWYETFGNRNHTAFLLIMGGCSQGILWPTTFCEMLAQLGFFVIRYDHRDVGLSTYFNFETQPYSLLDMAKDAASLLDYLEIRTVHLFGLSMGGPIAELISIHYPHQVLTLNLISTSCDFRPSNLAYAGLPEETHYPLSRTKEIYLNWMKNFLKESPTELEAQLKQRLDCWRILNGSSIPFEEELYREIHLQFLRRQTNLESLKNHLSVCQHSEQLIHAVPYKVKVPTLIFHGSEDIIFPKDHGEVLTAAIPHSQFIPVEGMGHVLNNHFYHLILRELKKHAETGKSQHECLQC